MAFKQSPAGATKNYKLTGTNSIDITTISAGDSNVKLTAKKGNDEVTIQSTFGYATKFKFNFDEGDDRLQIDASPNGNATDFWVRYSSFNGGDGNDILFADEDGLASSIRTAAMLDTVVNGDRGFDLIRSYGALNSTLKGGADEDTIELGYSGTPDQDRWNGSLITGNAGKDVIRIDIREKNFVDNKVLGESGADIIYDETGVSGNWLNSVIDGGSGSDEIYFELASSSLSILGGSGNDVIDSGTGNDTIKGGSGNDAITTVGGENVVNGNNGNDRIEFLTANGPGAGGVAYGDAGNDTLVADTGLTSSMYGGTGNDFVTVVDDAATEGSTWIEAGVGADWVNLEAGTAGQVVVQLDGQSIAATKFQEGKTGADRNIFGVWQDGDIITFGKGIDVVTGFDVDRDVFDTTVGDQGLNRDTGTLYNAIDVSPFDGMVFGKTYFLRGNYEFDGDFAPSGDQSGRFIIDDENGTDSIIWTQGNNGRVFNNANSFLVFDLDAELLSYNNII